MSKSDNSQNSTERDAHELKHRRLKSVLYGLQNLDAEDLDEVSVQVHKKLGEQAPPDEADFDIEHITEYEDQVKDYNRNWGKMAGLSTGLSTVDKMLMGLVKGELIVVAGETSMGKTLLAQTIAINVAKQGTGVLFITLENSKRQVAAKFARATGGVNLDIMFQKRDSLDWRDVDHIVKKAVEVNAGLVVVDHLHYFSRKLEHLAEDLGRVTKEMKTNAMRHDIPIILISHVKMRQQEKKLDEMMQNNKLRGSSYIAQDADCVLFVGRKKEEGDKTTYIKCTKNRDREEFSDVHTMRQLTYDDHILKDKSIFGGNK